MAGVLLSSAGVGLRGGRLGVGFLGYGLGELEAAAHVESHLAQLLYPVRVLLHVMLHVAYRPAATLSR